MINLYDWSIATLNNQNLTCVDETAVHQVNLACGSQLKNFKKQVQLCARSCHQQPSRQQKKDGKKTHNCNSCVCLNKSSANETNSNKLESSWKARQVSDLGV